MRWSGIVVVVRERKQPERGEGGGRLGSILHYLFIYLFCVTDDDDDGDVDEGKQKIEEWK